MPRLAIGLIAGAFALSLAQSAVAAEIVVKQGNKKFEPNKVTLKVGDSIKFVNDDTITHNVHSRSPGHKFDLGGQKPGTSVTHKFTKAGKVKIRCAIHPKMKLTVTVK